MGNVTKQMQAPVQIANRYAPRLPLQTSVLNIAVEKSKSAARSKESPRSLMLRSFLAGSYVIPMFILYILLGESQV